jgi:lipopolysaccharide transport protein LptA
MNGIFGMAGNEERPKNARTIIDSDDGANFENASNSADFIGHVIVRDPQFDLTCEKLHVVLRPDRRGLQQVIATGNVIVIQGTMRLTAPEVQVDYAADGKKIARLHATGGVTLANGGEAAEAQEAVYTIDSGQVVMTGDVLLTQGTSAISGKLLTVDLATGTGVMEGRVQTVFVPGSSTP